MRRKSKHRPLHRAEFILFLLMRHKYCIVIPVIGCTAGRSGELMTGSELTTPPPGIDPMSRVTMAKCFVSVALIAIAGVILHTVRADDQPPAATKVAAPKQELRDFMHKKLEASNKILEGLVMEDTDLIQEGATALSEMSSAEKWRVSNDAMYQQFSKEFQRTAAKLVDAAKEKNLDRAALRWMDTTMSCIECHRFVRNELVVGK